VTRGGPIYFTCCLVLDFAYALYFVLVIIHFNDENFGLWWDFFVCYFSRTSIDTFQWSLVDLFVDGLVGGHPFLVFLPCLVIEPCACEGRWQRRRLRFVV